MLQTCAPISELPSFISTMFRSECSSAESGSRKDSIGTSRLKKYLDQVSCSHDSYVVCKNKIIFTRPGVIFFIIGLKRFSNASCITPMSLSVGGKLNLKGGECGRDELSANYIVYLYPCSLSSLH